jgi:hypothetical protein
LRGPARRRIVAAAIAHAFVFGTWQSFAREQGLGTGETVELMFALIAAAGRIRPAADSAGSHAPPRPREQLRLSTEEPREK